MNSIFKGNVAFLIQLIIKLNPFGIACAVFFKACFILFQVISIWTLISWFSGAVVPQLQNIVGVSSDSYAYPALASLALIMASISNALSRYLGLKCVLKVEVLLERCSEGTDIRASDYKGVAKLLLALMDSLIPMLFILVIALFWLLLYPYAIPVVLLLFFLLLKLFKRAVAFSARRMKPLATRSTGVDYLNSAEHRHFHGILMIPQYITIVVYSFMALGVLLFSIFVKGYMGGDVDSWLGLLMIITAIAFIQFRSFISVAVRMGAYNSIALRVVPLLKASSASAKLD